MAKLTDEIIVLPVFNSTFVSKENSDFLSTETSLAEFFNAQINENMKGLIVYFYPRDNTAGCTVQAKDFTTMSTEFLQAGYTIIGVSRDGVESHQNFIDKQELGISLISDVDEALCQHFDVIKEKNMYGKKVLGLVRSTFVFNKDGILTHAQRNLRAKGYAERLLATLTQ